MSIRKSGRRCAGVVFFRRNLPGLPMAEFMGDGQPARYIGDRRVRPGGAPVQTPDERPGNAQPEDGPPGNLPSRPVTGDVVLSGPTTPRCDRRRDPGAPGGAASRVGRLDGLVSAVRKNHELKQEASYVAAVY